MKTNKEKMRKITINLAAVAAFLHCSCITGLSKQQLRYSKNGAGRYHYHTGRFRYYGIEIQ
ncbi:hypothetical protein NXU86_14165 [Phocaeicola vulgatus]|nr:hypothetical protein [Phocaeicola vulgatus]